MALARGIKLGPYEILSPLGAGGMGEVYRARDTRLGRDVAVKVLPDEVAKDAHALSRFEHEAKAVAALSHPNILAIFDVGEAGGVHYAVTELLEGENLRALISDGPLPVRRALEIAEQVAQGLAAAHEKGIVHRDVKPENVFVTKDGHVKILDFGLARTGAVPAGRDETESPTVEKLTSGGAVVGTVAYMSPEQARGLPVDHRSDQFSLGIVLYEMLTGYRPFKGASAAETLTAIIREEPEPLSKCVPPVPSPIRWFVERCLAKEPVDRYDSTRDLARELSSCRHHLLEVPSVAEAMVAAPAHGRRRALAILAGLTLAAVGLFAGWAIARGSGAKTPNAPSFHQLTFRQGRLGNARFTPDGEAIVYGARWRRVGGALESPRLFLTRPTSPESQSFDFANTDLLSISRKGELAMVQFSARGSVGTLAVAPLTGGAARKLVEDVSYAGADWAPNGKDLAVVRVVQGVDRAGFLDRTGHAVGRLEFPIGKVLVADGVRSPRFSPSGDEIAFFEGGQGTSSVSVIDKAGKSKKVLSAGWNTMSGVPAWAAGGQEIWFTGSQEPRGSAALWAVDRFGKRRLVMRVPGELELDDIAKDGRVLVAIYKFLVSLRGLAAGQSKEVELSWLDGSVAADLAADGKTLLFNEILEGGGGKSAIYLRGTEGSPAVRLGEGTGLTISPDGKWVLARGGEGELSLLPTGAGEARVLDTGSLRSGRGAGWLPDGKGVVFSAAAENGAFRIYVQTVPEGKPRAITPEATWIQSDSSPVSPDGRFVVGTSGARPDEKRAIYPIDGAGEARVVPGLAPVDVPVQWSSDSRSLYVTNLRERPLRIDLVEISTGKRRLWKEVTVEHSDAITSPRITPDGKSYLYGNYTTISELYLVEGLR